MEEIPKFLGTSFKIPKFLGTSKNILKEKIIFKCHIHIIEKRLRNWVSSSTYIFWSKLEKGGIQKYKIELEKI